jgi:hypothetical protein
MHVGELILVHTLGGTGGCQRRWIYFTCHAVVDHDLSCPFVVLTCFARIIDTDKSSTEIDSEAHERPC